MITATGAVLRIVAVLLLVIPFLPLTLLQPDEGSQLALVPPGGWLLGIVVFVPVAWVLAGALDRSGVQTPRWLMQRGQRIRGPLYVTLVLLALAALLYVTSTFAFDRRPLLIDGIVQLFQARIFAAGTITAPEPPNEAFFATQHMVADAGKWYAQYPPGHPGVLALGLHMGASWIVPIALTLGTAALVFGFIRRIYDDATARLTLVLLLFTPFFWFMGASHANHVSTAFFIALFLYVYARWEKKPTRWLAFVGGAALGAAFLSRPLTALVIGACFALFVLARDPRSDAEHATGKAARSGGRVRRSSVLAAGAAGFLAIGSVYLAFNAATTGDPLLPGYLKLWGESHGLGFHATPWGGVHTPLQGLRNEALDLALLHSMLFEWPIPSLLPAGLLLALGWDNRAWDHRLFIAFLSLPVAYLFYWHRDAFLGPRFLYAGVLFVVPLTARFIVEAFRRLKGRLWKPGLPGLRVRATSFLAAILLLSFGYTALYGAPARFRVYAGSYASLKFDLAEAAHETGIDHDIIFVAVSWGNRLLARMRGLEVPAALAEQAYRGLDHCLLEQTVSRGERAGWSGSMLTARLRRLLAIPFRLSAPATNGDPTLRLERGRPLRPECAAELRHDRTGYSNFGPHLPANSPALNGDLVIARDLGERNAELRGRYPGRHAYLYRPGRLIRLW